eukprot:GHRQ01021802.1.p1 GENE.GHRQ01021802.1~~GHRQ01021802.1.p1  ORF type:complete len:159 (+),score=90.54 GHRQ01021802.1:1505-1981(+)
MVQRSNVAYADAGVEQQLQLWLEGLLGNDQEVVEEVYGLLQERSSDWQQLRTWVRQLQQAQQEQQQQQTQSQQQLSSSSGSGGSNQDAAAAAGGMGVQQLAVQDPEVQQLILELAGKQQQQPAAQGKATKGQGKSPSAVARRSIRNMLSPLAIAMHAQ